MNTIITLLIIVAFSALVLFIAAFVIMAIRRNSPSSTSAGEQKPWPLGINANFLSAAEQSFYGVLTQMIADRYLVFPKVNLGDVLFIHKNTDNSTRQSLFNRISRKHLDFLLLDPKTMTPVLAIELDDSSHQGAAAQKRDAVKEKALGDAGLKLIRIPVKAAYTRDDLSAILINDIFAYDASDPGVDEIRCSDPDESLSEAEIQSSAESDSSRIPICPKCKIEMVMRTSTKGSRAGSSFWGCPNYPHCRETKQVAENDDT